MKNPLKSKNLFDSPITTIAGLLLLVAGITTVIAFGIPWTESMVPIAIGLLLMLSPDTLISYLKRLLNISDQSEDNNKEQ